MCRCLTPAHQVPACPAQVIKKGYLQTLWWVQRLVLMCGSPAWVPWYEQGSVPCVSMETSEAISYPGTGAAHRAPDFLSLTALHSSGPRDPRHRGDVFLPRVTEGLWSCLKSALGGGTWWGSARPQQALEWSGFGFGCGTCSRADLSVSWVQAHLAESYQKSFPAPLSVLPVP